MKNKLLTYLLMVFVDGSVYILLIYVFEWIFSDKNPLSVPARILQGLLFGIFMTVFNVFREKHSDKENKDKSS